MSNILQDFFRERNKKRGFDGAVDKFLNWQAGRPEDDGIAVRPEEYPENNPENTGTPIAVVPEDYPENDPSLAGTDPVELMDSDYMKGADQLLPPLAVPAESPDEPPVDMPLIQQLQESGMLGPGDDKQPAREPESQGGYAEGYEKGEDGMLRPKAKPQQYAGPVTPDGRMPEKVESPQPADPNVTAAGIQKKQDDEDTASVLAQEDGMSLSDVGLPEYSYIDETDGRDSWRNADLSPLPGEETLHEDIRKWADTNKTAGGTGLQGLRQAYLEEVPVKSRKLLGFNQWLETKGFDPENEMGYRGNRESLNRVAPMPGLDGSSVESHRARLRKQKVIGSYLRRYGDESVLQDPMTRAEAEEIYDNAYSNALENGENPVLAAGRALHGYSQEFQQDKDAQLRQNVSNRASQMHRAQRFGVPVGLVAAVDQYRNAGDDPIKQQQALLMGAMMYPQVFLPIYQSQAYATNQAAMIAGMNNGTQPDDGTGGVGGLGDQTGDIDPMVNNTRHLQHAQRQGLETGGAATLSSAMTGMEPDAKRRTLSTTFPGEMNAAKNAVIDGHDVSIATRNIISEALGPNPTIQEMQQLFPGPMSQDEYEKLRAYFSGTEGKSWLESIGEGMTQIGNSMGDWWPDYAPTKD